MFEDTLLIIKSDYMHKRKSVLLKLLQKDFQIQGHRKVLFSPEHAAEFYKDLAEDKSFMLQVILLSKGNAEAFILTKENAVEDLVNTMVCYFLTSMEMERNVHVSKNPASVHREISFIFPNYIHEPIPYFEQPKFCQNPLMSPLIDELYDIIQGGGSGPSAELQQENWPVKLAEWLTMSNKTLPHVSNQCSRKPTIGYEEKGQQVGSSFKRQLVASTGAAGAPGSSRSPSLSLSSAGSSAMITSSSCITCSCFDGHSGEICLHPPPHDPCDILKHRTKSLPHEHSEDESPPLLPPSETFELPAEEEKELEEEERTEKELEEEECDWKLVNESEMEEEFGPPEPKSAGDGPPPEPPDMLSDENLSTVAIVVEDVDGELPVKVENAPEVAVEITQGPEVEVAIETGTAIILPDDEGPGTVVVQEEPIAEEAAPIVVEEAAPIVVEEPEPMAVQPDPEPIGEPEPVAVEEPEAIVAEEPPTAE